MTITDMCKRHTELNVLVCCLSRVRKRTIYDGFMYPSRAILTLSLRGWKIFGAEKLSCVKFSSS